MDHLRKGIQEIKNFDGEVSELDVLYNKLSREYRLAAKETGPNVELYNQLRLAAQETRARLHRNSEPNSLRSRPKRNPPLNSPNELLGQDITSRLQSLNRTLQSECERASASFSLLQRSTQRLRQTHASYQSFSNLISLSKGLVKDVGRMDANDRWAVYAAFGVLVIVVLYVFVRRAPIPWFLWPWHWPYLVMRLIKRFRD